MPRTTTELVAGLVNGVPADADLTPFIDTAHLVVNDNCAASGYSDAKLELLERWLAAHYVCIFDPRTKSADADGPKEAYEDIKVDLGFNVTKYGQQALRLDTAGSLAALNNALNKVTIPLPVKAGVVSTRWLGGWNCP